MGKISIDAKVSLWGSRKLMELITQCTKKLLCGMRLFGIPLAHFSEGTVTDVKYLKKLLVEYFPPFVTILKGAEVKSTNLPIRKTFGRRFEDCRTTQRARFKHIL